MERPGSTGPRPDGSSGSTLLEAPKIALPPGGGAIRGLGEKFGANPVNGTLRTDVPLPFTPGRSGFGPQMALSYDSGNALGPFGFGWMLPLPAVSRRTDRRLPDYGPTDTFLLSGSEELVPVIDAAGTPVELTRVVAGASYRVQRFRPRVDDEFSRIERWTRSDGDVHWRVGARDGGTSVFGDVPDARIADPDDALRVFSWLLTRLYDDRGNVVVYEYKRENADGVPDALFERNRTRTAHLYLKRIRYGHATPYEAEGAVPEDWHFCAVFDYGDHRRQHPAVEDDVEWPVRLDSFSQFRAGFEIRQHRRCRRMLMFHRFPELGAAPVLVRSADFEYDDDAGGAAGERARRGSFMTRVVQHGYLPDGTGEAYPPLEFFYSPAEIDATLRTLGPDALAAAPAALADPRLQLVDLDGEGVPGLLERQSGAWTYRRASPQYSGSQPRPGYLPAVPLARLPASAANHDRAMLLDVDGSGQLSLVERSGAAAGVYGRTPSDGWRAFRPFDRLPAAALASPAARFVDLDGDGLADVVIAGDDVICWHRSLGVRGFDAETRRLSVRDEDRGPRVVFAEARETIFLADMNGDGLADIVRITPGRVVYWPALGHGRFGPAITMPGAPRPEPLDEFDVRRLRLADIDGTGTTDLIYLGVSDVEIYFNRCGNEFEPATRLGPLPLPDSLTSVQVLDLTGAGTASIAWSTRNPQGQRALAYVDVLRAKPHLLVRSLNNMGAETRVAYTSSTREYVEARHSARPWRTRLPFPVHVVAEIETYDHVAKTKTATRFRYSDGYFDPVEREFRGFGRVEQWDTQDLPRFSGTGLFTEVPATAGDEFHLPAVRTITWYHTGAVDDGGAVSRHYAVEYWRGDPAAFDLPDSELPSGLSIRDEQEATRALRGKPLRSEVYAEDGGALADRPYVVTEYTYAVQQLQAGTRTRHSVVRAYERSSLASHYERTTDDPRLTQSLVLEVDDFGVVRRSAKIAYPRRAVAGRRPEQARFVIDYAEAEVAHRASDVDVYRIGIPVEARKYELSIAPPANGAYLAAEFAAAAAAAAPLDAGSTVPTGPWKRLLEQQRTLYRSDDLASVLPRGATGRRAITAETYTLVLAAAQRAALYGGRVTDAVLATECGYVDLDGDGRWWAPSGRAFFTTSAADGPAVELAAARARFFQPVRQRSPFGGETLITLDPHALLPVETVDAVGNRLGARIHYRTMTPQLLVDPNGHGTAVRLNALGMVVATFALSAAAGEGDAFDAASDEASATDRPSTVFDYDLHAFELRGQPVLASVRKRTGFAAAAPWDESWVYSDGAGQEILRKVRVEDGDAPQRGADGALLRDGGGAIVIAAVAPRYVGTGRVLRDNKANVVKTYEPFFDSTPAFVDEQDLVQIGVTPIRRYDPLGRAIRTDLPDGTFTRTTFGPWWRRTEDESDTVLESRWYLDRGAPAPTSPEPGNRDARAAWLSARQANTPLVEQLDPSGRIVGSVLDAGVDAGGAPIALETTFTFDAAGRELSVIDPLGREVVRFAYDAIGRRVRTESMDGGARLTLFDAAGQLVRAWDSRGHVLRVVYDAARRPTHQYIASTAGTEILAERMVYGEAHPEAARNLRGRVHLHFDGSGLARSDAYDFQGRLVRSTRRFARVFDTAPDWSSLAAASVPAQAEAAADPLLHAEAFETRLRHDALGRVVQAVTPAARDGRRSITQAAYQPGGQLAAVHVWNRRAGAPADLLPDAGADATVLSALAYDAKGQRLEAEYGNGVVSRWSYDPLTFRLAGLRTTRGAPYTAAERVLQDLGFTHDAAGNVVEVVDAAQPDVYFANQRVDASMRFEFDAAQRLVSASGREHLGRTGGALAAATQPGPGLIGRRFPHPHDGTALGRYTERYDHDAAGNLRRVVHTAESGGWTRLFRYAENSLLDPAVSSNRLSASSLPGDAPLGPYSETYGHDASGNVTSMPHLSRMDWNHQDRLTAVSTQVMAAGTGETTYMTYDAAGRRTRRVTVARASAGARVLGERLYLGNFEIHREYAPDGTVVLERETLHCSGGTDRAALIETKTLDVDDVDVAPLGVSLVRYQHHNHLHSATVETDGAARIVSYEEFYPYGGTAYRLRSAVARASEKRYGFAGRERDDDTGLCCFAERYYAPWLCRWISCDPAGLADGPNVYRYARGNPITLTDPEGTASTPNDGVYGQLMEVVEYGKKVLNRGSLGTNVQGDHPIQVALDKLRTFGEYTRELSKAEGEFVVLAETGVGKFHTELGKLQLDIGKRTLAGDLWRGLSRTIEEAAAAKGLKIKLPAPPSNLIMSQSQLIEETKAAYLAAAKATGATVKMEQLDAAIASHMGVLFKSGGSLAEAGARLKDAPKLAEMIALIAASRRFASVVQALEPLAVAIKPIASRLGPIGIVLTVLFGASEAHAATAAAARGDGLGAAQKGLDTVKQGFYLAGFRFPPALIPAVAIDATEYADKKIGFSDYGAQKGVEAKESLQKFDFFRRHDTTAEVIGGTVSVLKAWEYALVPGAMLRDKAIDRMRAR